MMVITDQSEQYIVLHTYQWYIGVHYGMAKLLDGNILSLQQTQMHETRHVHSIHSTM